MKDMKYMGIYNMNIIKIVVATLVAILLLILSFWFGRWTYPVKNTNQSTTYTHDTTKIYDTVLKEVPIIRIKEKAVIEYLTDTLYTTKPFNAKLDTIMASRDTIGAMYSFPSNNFYLEFRRHPDSLIIKTQTVNITTTKEVKREWYIDAATHIAVFSLGFLFGTIK